jgi:hypothetical protein
MEQQLLIDNSWYGIWEYGKKCVFKSALQCVDVRVYLRPSVA